MADVTKTYPYKILHAIDVFACTLLFRDSDVTISAMTGLAMRKANPPWWARALNAFLNAIQRGHCEMAIQADIERAQAAIRLLQGDA